MIESSGELTMQMTEEGKNYFNDIFNAPRKVVMSVDPKTMQKFRAVKPGATLEIYRLNESLTYKILRRDWKRNKLFLLEVKP